MGLHHRKLLSESECERICDEDCTTATSSNCVNCLKFCNSYNPPPTPSDHTKHKTTTYLIISFSIVAAIFLVLCCYAFYVKFFSRRNRSRRRALLTRQQTEQGFVVGEEHDDGSVVDHPIWYIRTPGLQQSIINAITVVKYKKDEGLIDGSDCSVCLSEFEEDENLRLLPKCNHAFHLPCIDTWLRSHTNCPMCRAPIVNNPTVARVESLESVIVVDDSSSSSLEHTQIDVFDENSGESETNLGFENSAFDSESRNWEENDGGQSEVCENERQVVDVVSIVRPRRSVSMDNFAFATVLSIESNGNGDSSKMSFNDDAISKVNGNENLATTSKGSSSFSFRPTRYLQGVPSPMKRSSSYNGKFLLSWFSSNQKKPNDIFRNL